MNCRETEEVIHGYLDGELDLVRSLDVEQHLKDCPGCARTLRERRALRTAIAGAGLNFDAPKELERKIRAALPQPAKPAARAERATRRFNWSWPGILAPFAAAALALLIGLPVATWQSGERRLGEEIVSAHVRSLMVEHLTDVASTDQHTVKPWYDGKLDFAPPVTDLADRGFPLVGGRLDYVHGRRVAALVYQRRKHFINLFIWPAANNSDTSKRSAVLRGYNQVHWNASGMTFWVVSDLSSGELSEFAQLIK
jgi:anti-sigma factor RsiW